MGQRFTRTDQGLSYALCNDRAALVGQLDAARRERVAERVANRLGSHGADRAGRDQEVEDRANAERADEADRHVALRILGLLGRGRDRVEADVSEEDRGRGADHAIGAPAVGNERREVTALEDRQSENAEDGQRRDLHQDEDRIEPRTLLGADDQQDGHETGNYRRRQVEYPTAKRTRGERSGDYDPPALHQADEIA